MNLNKKVCLVIIFNHRHEEVLPKLRSLYRDRFENLWFLMPFYSGKAPDVIPVYASSDVFQGFLAQASRTFINPVTSHYVFVADDLLLNPVINASNICSLLSITDNSAFIKKILPLAFIPVEWPHFLRSVDCFNNFFVKYSPEIPSFEEASYKFSKHSITIKNISFLNIFKKTKYPFLPRHHIFGKSKGILAVLRYLLDLNYGKLRSKKLPYPLVYSYSDFFVVPQQSIKEFCRICGVFAAMGMFAETAIPTSLLLTCDRVVQEADIKMTGLEIWSSKEMEDIGKQHNFSLSQLLLLMPTSQLYIHPIKLSKWND